MSEIFDINATIAADGNNFFPQIGDSRSFGQFTPDAVSMASLGVGTAVFCLSQLSSAIIVVDDNRRVIYKNDYGARLIKRGDALTCDSGNMLRCCDRNAEKRLKEFIFSIRDTALNLRKHSGLVLAMRGDESWPMVAFVSAVPTSPVRSATGDAEQAHHIVLMLRNPGEKLYTKHDALQKLFNLSQAEAAIVLSLAEGNSVYDIAEQRGTSIHTVRSQIKSAQAKAGVYRQSELVALTLRSTLF